ncbi:LysR substrate-binding domain-containing protein [Pollutimonas harenae]|uniref:LysR family transcriptional regulator n=1 Tax=Pollutimonas harenae TaxID=657015 RepID=A0A853GU25_9BURK|nr:LysR substrate-binding domain-containing protein [Pollutimonas harenae]NYT84286.1 LysR family transcriptional regulator [Pollutimonas harenae]TEA73308.1 LysR family transcriptional regulator [Pollutimonas harenae]
MRPSLSLKSIQAFEAAARLGSFAAAAAELNLTPSAISHQIRLLEERMGITLFHRIHRGIVLTDAGRHYAEAITRGLGIIDAATLNMQNYGKQDILTIHCAPTLASQWLMPKLSHFSMLHPDIGIRLNASTSPIDLTAEAADFDVRYGPVNPEPGTIVVPFPKEPLAVMCAPEVAYGDKPINSPKDLQHHTLIQSEVNLITWQDWAKQHQVSASDMHYGPRFDRSFMAISAAVDGLGVILDSRLQTEREVASGKLVLPLGTEPALLVYHRLLYLQAKAHLPKMVAFKDWLFDQLNESFNKLNGPKTTNA